VWETAANKLSLTGWCKGITFVCGKQDGMMRLSKLGSSLC